MNLIVYNCAKNKNTILSTILKSQGSFSLCQNKHYYVKKVLLSHCYNQMIECKAKGEFHVFCLKQLMTINIIFHVNQNCFIKRSLVNNSKII